MGVFITILLVAINSGRIFFSASLVRAVLMSYSSDGDLDEPCRLISFPRTFVSPTSHRASFASVISSYVKCLIASAFQIFSAVVPLCILTQTRNLMTPCRAIFLKLRTLSCKPGIGDVKSFSSVCSLIVSTSDVRVCSLRPRSVFLKLINNYLEIFNNLVFRIN